MSGSNERLVVDTNVLIYYLRGYKGAEQYFFNFIPVVSFIAELELLSFPELSEQESGEIKHFLSVQARVGYMPDMQDQILIIRKAKKLKLPDAIIAATAMHFHIPLVSSDKAFSNIEGLDFIYFEPPNV